jgi:hypothetical protein
MKWRQRLDLWLAAHIGKYGRIWAALGAAAVILGLVLGALALL